MSLLQSLNSKKITYKKYSLMTHERWSYSLLHVNCEGFECESAVRTTAMASLVHPLGGQQPQGASQETTKQLIDRKQKPFIS